MVRALFILALATAASGCSMNPWVKPYELGNLDDPIMAFDRHPAARAYLKRVHEAREAARGADGSGGGRCGCN